MNSTAFEPSPAKPRHGLPVLDRMMTLELAKTELAVLTVLVTIIVSRKFLVILTKAIEGEIAGDTLMTLLGLKTLAVLIILLPSSLFLAILMLCGRMYRDQEMAVLASSGVGFARLYKALAWFVIPFCLASAFLSLQVTPWAENEIQDLLRKDKRTADLRGIKPGRFNEFSRGDVVLYAESVGAVDNTMHKIFVQSRSGDKSGVTLADSGYLTQTDSGSHFVVLEKGIRYQGTPGKVDYVISEFGEYAVKIDADPDNGQGWVKRESAIPSQQLLASSTPRELAELQRRLAIPLGVLLLALMAIPISRVAPRSGVYGNVVSAFLLYMMYENLQRVSQGLLLSGKVPVWLGYCGVYIIMLLIIGIFLLRSLGLRWCWQVIRGKALR